MEEASKKSENEKDEELSSKTSDEKPNVHSTAVVKYAKMGPMGAYSTLELNTDINEPPDNWLHDNLQGRFSDWTSAKHETDLSSFNMAHSFLENIDDVDVISDAENIKKLLKMPFSKTGISLSVNKVGKTLLLDEFDVPSVLSHAAQKEKLEHMQWLQDVFSVEANIEKNQTLLRRKKNPQDSRERNMMSKFLCYSSPEASVDDDQGSLDATPFQTISSGSSCRDLVPFLPEPVLQPQEQSKFQRNVLWKFEDTKMLIGSNMPIFGGGKYPAVSLRLNDCSKPINVLTGLDYWLDNLMCNVPEVVMCFHMDGIVQKYEHYKTDELPNIEGSQFSPKVIKDVARNILSFLKSNCTQEGHTYWLFKGNGSDVVKLYDLTSLSDKTSNDSTNPFSVPVAMLLYRVAKNMMNQSNISEREQSMVQLLLTNCLDLLNNEPRPDDHLEIMTSSHYLLAEVYSLTNQKPAEEVLENTERYSSPVCDDDEYPWPKTLAIGDLSKSNNFEEPYDEAAVNFPENVNEKLQISLSHVVKALKSLRRAMDDHKFSVTGKDTKRQTVLPSRPYILALPDATFTARTGDEYVTPVAGSSDDMTPPNFNFRQWQGTFESVLLRKAAGLYSDLASLAHADGAHGLALRYLRLSLLLLSSYRNLEWVNSNQELDLLPTVLCSCADVYMSMAKSRDLRECMGACEKDYGAANEYDEYFDEHYRISDEAVYQLDVEFFPDVEKLLQKSEMLYERALDVSSDSRQVELLVTVTRRLGNIRNELGMFYMNTAVKITNGADDVMPEELWKKSLESLNAGIRAFEAVDDRPNIAFLHSNVGRLMRLCAQSLFNVADRRGTFTPREKSYYLSAIEHYQKSLLALGERKLFPEVWDRVTWELSGTYYTMGTLIQDYFSLKESEAETCEREVSDLMFKSLKLCEGLQFPDENLNLDVKHRIGTVHYRLASLYHNSWRMLPVSDASAKKKRHLADLHYSKAAELIDVTRYPTEWLRMNLERVALLEHQIGSVRSKGSGASKILDSILELLLNSRQAFEAYNAKMGRKYTGNSEKDDKYGGQGQHTDKHYSDESVDRIKSELKAGNMDKNAGDILLKQTPTSDKQNSGGTPRKCASNMSAEEVPGHDEKSETEKMAEKEFLSLVDIFEARLNNCLKERVKLGSAAKIAASTQQKERENVLKRMFELTLRARVTREPGESLLEQCDKILHTIAALEELRVE